MHMASAGFTAIRRRKLATAAKTLLLQLPASARHRASSGSNADSPRHSVPVQPSRPAGVGRHSWSRRGAARRSKVAVGWQHEVVAVHLTRIYTRTGDDGTTALGDGSRVAKTDARVATFADVDETNSAIGMALALGNLPSEVATVLRQVQNDLFDVGADLCTPLRPDPPYPALRITDAYVQHLERWCDEFNASLSTLDSFILPGGTAGAALLHTARTVARRAERSAWLLSEADAESVNELAVQYLNRLSDLLFILARCANPDGDVLWRPGGDS